MLTLDTWNVKAPIKYLDNGTSDISGLLVMKWLKSLYVNVGHATCHQNDSLMMKMTGMMNLMRTVMINMKTDDEHYDCDTEHYDCDDDHDYCDDEHDYCDDDL